MSDDWNNSLKRTCANCGTTFEEFAQSAALGCALCYDEFADLLEPVLRRMHGVARRSALGNAPEPAIPRTAPTPEQSQTQLNFMLRDELEMELHLALLEENYERAASIRDKLKSLS